MKVLDFNKSKKDEVFSIGSDTLDTLWDTASKLGRVEISQTFGQTVEIRFERSSGTIVYAKGKHTDIREAFRLAISEVKDLGGK